MCITHEKKKQKSEVGTGTTINLKNTSKKEQQSHCTARKTMIINSIKNNIVCYHLSLFTFRDGSIETLAHIGLCTAEHI